MCEKHYLLLELMEKTVTAVAVAEKSNDWLMTWSISLMHTQNVAPWQKQNYGCHTLILHKKNTFCQDPHHVVAMSAALKYLQTKRASKTCGEKLLLSRLHRWLNVVKMSSLQTMVKSVWTPTSTATQCSSTDDQRLQETSMTHIFNNLFLVVQSS